MGLPASPPPSGQQDPSRELSLHPALAAVMGRKRGGQVGEVVDSLLSPSCRGSQGKLRLHLPAPVRQGDMVGATTWCSTWPSSYFLMSAEPSGSCPSRCTWRQLSTREGVSQAEGELNLHLPCWESWPTLLQRLMRSSKKLSDTYVPLART